MTRQQAGVSAERLLDMILKLSEDIDQELWGAEGSKEINARGRIVPLISAFADTLLATTPPEQATTLREVRARHDKFWLWRTSEWKLAWLSGEFLVVMGETYRFGEGDFDDSPAIPLSQPKDLGSALRIDNLSRTSIPVVREETAPQAMLKAERAEAVGDMLEAYENARAITMPADPPEQAALLREEGIHNAYLSGLAAAKTSEGEKSVAGGRVSNPTAAKNYDLPQPESAGALIERITAYLSLGGLFNPELAEHVHVRDLLIACREALLPSLAAHDQKVRAEALEEAADCCDGAQRDKWQGEKAGLTVEQTRLWNKWVTDLGDEIRALAAPAASKPEAGKP